MKRKQGPIDFVDRSPVRRRIEHPSRANLSAPEAKDIHALDPYQQLREHNFSERLQPPREVQKEIMEWEEPSQINIGQVLSTTNEEMPQKENWGNKTNNMDTLAVTRGISNTHEQREQQSQLSDFKHSDSSVNDVEFQRRQTNQIKMNRQGVFADVTALKSLQQNIEVQFGLEILLKHKELRLIDQEIAKCQVSLEQLRRCQIIPYPALSNSLEDMQADGNGSGHVYDSQALHSAPWGVTSGPYTRHYQKWLIPDPAFDDSVAEDQQTIRGGGRARASLSEKSTLASKSRSQRGSTSARFHALPQGYPEPKEEKGPMILKRSTDGKMVKLVCLDCRRDNFNSAQGFINHCRIAHARLFVSHDAAAIACGEEVDFDPATGVTGESNSVTSTSASAGLVHPLVRSAHIARSTPTSSTSSKRKRPHHTGQATSLLSMAVTNKLSTTTRPPYGTPNSNGPAVLLPFTPSPQTPHLSALFRKTGTGGDLDDMVNQAKTKTNLDVDLSSEDENHDMENGSEVAGDPLSHSTRGVLCGSRLPARSAISPVPLQRSHSSKGPTNGSRKPDFLPDIKPHTTYSSPYTTASAFNVPANLRPNHPEEEAGPLNPSTSLNHSPNTIESHPAPSLVSDDGDYEGVHSESDIPSSDDAGDDEDRYLDVEVEDHDAEIGLGGSGSSVAAVLSLGKSHHPSARRSAAPSLSATIRDRGAHVERRVNSTSAGRRTRRDVGQKGARKRESK